MKPVSEPRPRFREPPLPAIQGLSPSARTAIGRDLSAAQASLGRAYKTATYMREDALAKRIQAVMAPIGEEIVRLNGGPVVSISDLLG